MQWQHSAQVGKGIHVQLATRQTFQLICFFTAGERRKRGKTDRRSTELSTIIRNCLEQTILLELMPSSQIDVYVQVLQVSHPRSLHYQCVLPMCVVCCALHLAIPLVTATCLHTLAQGAHRLLRQLWQRLTHM